MNSFRKDLKENVFWPPFLLIVGALIYSVSDGEAFLNGTTMLKTWMLDHFASLFSIGALAICVGCVGVFFSPFGKLRIGGPNAKPFLTWGKWVAIAVCTNTAVGVLFWATAEPIYHLIGPPESLGLSGNSQAARVFALSTLYMHWSIIPCALYAVPALMFAYAYYNLRAPFSISSCLVPLLGKYANGSFGTLVNGLCLYTLVAGMAASLATGILTLAGGMEYLWGVEGSAWLYLGIGGAIVFVFVLSAASGLQKGIRILSEFNMKLFMGIAIFILVFAPTSEVLMLSGQSLSAFFEGFFSNSLRAVSEPADPWGKDWTVFYWAVWMAWAPVTALFLGRIGYGYSVRAFLLVNFVAPAAFAILWMSILGGATLSLEAQGAGLAALLKQNGAEAVAYGVFSQLPMSNVMIPLFLLTVFVAYVTAADSNTTAMAGICARGISPEKPEPPLWIKVTWGGTLGLLAFTMLSLSGIDGIKTLSYLGGLPALFLELAILISLVKTALLFRSKKAVSNTEMFQPA